MTLTEQMLSGLPGDPLVGLRQADDLWLRYRSGTLPAAHVIHQVDGPLDSVDWDVVICGGTLGILVGAGLAGRPARAGCLAGTTARMEYFSPGAGGADGFGAAV